jgi:hypothetical protein
MCLGHNGLNSFVRAETVKSVAVLRCCGGASP